MGKKSNRKKALRKTVKPTVDTAAPIFFLLGSIVLFVWTIGNARISFIPRADFWLTIAGSGLLTMILLTNLGPAGWKSGIVTLGSFVLGCALGYCGLVNINYYGRSNTTREVQVVITEKGYTSSRRSPRCPKAMVVLNNAEREIRFPCEMKEQVDSAKTLYLTVVDGAFKYPVYISKRLP